MKNPAHRFFALPVSSSARKYQRGSIAINAAIALSVIVITLLGTEIGYLSFQKRNLQKAVDLAALAGTRQLALTNCADAAVAANTNATQNLRGLAGPRTIVPQCGQWVAPLSGAAENVDGFTETATNPIAVKVTITATPNLLLPNLPGNQTRAISVSAVAKLDRPIASFSVGSSLINLDWNDNTRPLLGLLLKGIGLDLSGTSLITYNGLAKLNVTPAGLLKALDVKVDTSMSIGQLNALLAGQLQVRPLIDVLNATISLADPQGLLGIKASVLVDAIKAKLGLSSLDISLGSITDSPTGLFAQIVAPGSSANSALNVNVNALDLVYAAIGVATQKHALETGLNINLLSLAKVTTKVAVIEPPSIAIGGIGAKAYTAQVRTYIRVTTDSGLLGGLLSPLIKLDLPIVLDLVTGQGELTKMCTPELKLNGKDRANIEVTGAILKACIGKIPDSALFSNAKACDADLQDMELLNVLGLLRLPSNSVRLNGLAIPAYQALLAEGERATTPPNPLALGDLVSNLVTQLTNLLFGRATPSQQAPTSGQINNLVDQIWNDTASICTQDIGPCRGQRLDKAKQLITTNTSQSGLLSGLLQGVADLLGFVANQCTGVLSTGLFGSTEGCKNMLREALSTPSSGPGGSISNTLSYLTGLLRPVLNAVGSSVLTPVLQGTLGLKIGQIDVHLEKLTCNADPMLVH